MPFVIPSVVKIALGIIGTGAAVHWMLKEVRRINEELERARAMSMADAKTRQGFPTLRRDPHSGDWRVTR
jgi:hypothetical protein